MSMRRFGGTAGGAITTAGAGVKKQKELTEEQKQVETTLETSENYTRNE